MPTFYRGRDLEALIEGARRKIEDQSRRMVAKGRSLPGVRVETYIEAQACPAVRDALRKLMGGRRWRYVSFVEFRETLARLGRRMLASLSLSSESSSACFVVDSLSKSSFWVLALLLVTCPPESYDRLSLAVDAEGAGGGMYTAFRDHLLPPLQAAAEGASAFFSGEGRGGKKNNNKKKNKNSKPFGDFRLVLLDDATYSGDQLSYFHDHVVEQFSDAALDAGWDEAACRRGPDVTVAVPFMSKPSIPLLKRRKATALMYEDSFAALFHRRTLASVLASDLYIMHTSPYFSEVHSFFFDFLGILPTNTLVIFEHKVADMLSIPNRWLQLGPCLDETRVAAAFRVREDRLPDMARVLRASLGGDKPGLWGAPDWGAAQQQQLPPGSSAQRALLTVSRRAIELMSRSPKFREAFLTRVDLAADRPRPPPFFPLIPPEFCDVRYRRFVETQLGKPTRSIAGIDDVPPCRRPPYKRSSFKRRIARRV